MVFPEVSPPSGLTGILQGGWISNICGTCVVVASSADLQMMESRWKRWLHSLEYADYFPRTLVSAVIKGELTRKDDILALLIR